MTALARLKAYVRPPGDPSSTLRASILRRQKLIARLRILLPYFRIVLILAGFVYLLALPWQGLGRNHYVSENALQPGQVGAASSPVEES
jgi:glycosylphosphatidylinositol transamidase